jgi:Tfp pilus assembly protein PilO
MEREIGMLQKLSTREKILICLVVWVAGAYLFYRLAYEPLSKEVSKLEQQNHTLMQQAAATRKIDQNKDKFNSERKRYEQEYTVLAQPVPINPYIPEVITFMEKTALKSNAQLVSIKYSQKPETNVKNAQTLDFDMSVSGSYYNLVTFLEALEKAPRKYNCMTATLQTQEKKQETVTIPAETAEAEPTTVEPPKLTGVDRYDPNNKVMNVTVQTYYYGKNWPGIPAAKEIEPSKAGRDNPFNL